MDATFDERLIGLFVVTQDDLVSIEARALRIQNPRANAVGRVSIAVDQEDSFVGQAQGVVRMTDDACVLSRLPGMSPVC